MFSFRFALVPFLLSMSAVTSALAGAGMLKATVTPVSNIVTYSVPGASPPLNMFVGYKMKFQNIGSNTVNNVSVTFSLDNAGMTLFDPGTYLPPGCVPASDNKSFTCTVIQMKSGDLFAEFPFFYNSPTDPTPGDSTDVTSVASKVIASYAETTNGNNPPVNSANVDIGGVSSVTLGTVNTDNIKSGIPKSGGKLQTGNAGVPTTSNKATELLVVPQLPGSATNYTVATVIVDLITGTAEAQCTNLGHFIQCPIFSTGIPTDPNLQGSLPLQFTPSAPLSMTYRVHPSNLKMSASQILNSVSLSYQPSGATGFVPVTAICPSATTANSSGVPCIVWPPQCYKNNTPGGLAGVCEWKTNNTENGLLKLQ
jgi:hypothetical protein